MVSEHQQGLRFDIYERVHLAEGALGIKELDEVELVPHIQVLPQGEQAVLRGNLLLNGKYVDEQDGSGRTLEHLIPVEITLPMNRFGRVEDISVEIENFDVDLLSTRSLNVTGVLSLSGFELAQPEQESWREPEEEIVFVHQIETREAAQAPEPAAEAEAEPAAEAFSRGAEPQAAAAPPEEAAQVSAFAEEPAAEEEAEAVAAVAAVDPAESEAAAPAEEKKELKIAFSGKSPSTQEDPVKTYGLKSLLHSASSIAGSSRQEAAAPPANELSADAIEWKKLLLSTSAEQQPFRKVKLVIVQKDETLEAIAERYKLNAREIALHNRLAEHELRAGQILSLPK